MKKVFDIVSHPDTVVILKNPLASFAVWDQADVVPVGVDPESSCEAEPGDEFLVDGNVADETVPEEPTWEERTSTWGELAPALEEPPSEVPPSEEPTPEEHTPEEPTPSAGQFTFDEPTVQEEPEAIPEATETLVGATLADEPGVDVPISDELGAGEPVVQEPSDREYSAPITKKYAEEVAAEPSPNELFTDEEEIHYHVSAQHLRLASTRFESMLSGGTWKESVRDKLDGLHHIFAEDWDPEAFLILLNVIHHRNRQVPRSVSLEMLAKIVVLIDYYDCAEAVELCTERWVEKLKQTSPVPSSFCRNLMLWMCIAWVLKLPNEFKQTTNITIMRKEYQELSTLGLPITSCIDKIEQVRIDTTKAIISQLHVLLEEYGDPDYQCPYGNYSFECGSILYGALRREMQLAGLLVPDPGMNVSKIVSKTKSFRSPLWYHTAKPKIRSRHPCDSQKRVVGIVDGCIRSGKGLDLKDFGAI